MMLDSNPQSHCRTTSSVSNSDLSTPLVQEHQYTHTLECTVPLLLVVNFHTCRVMSVCVCSSTQISHRYFVRLFLALLSWSLKLNMFFFKPCVCHDNFTAAFLDHIYCEFTPGCSTCVYCPMKNNNI